jgi:hypothetical protein
MIPSRNARASTLVLLAVAATASCGDGDTPTAESAAPLVSVPAYSYGADRPLKLVSTSRGRTRDESVRRVIDRRGGWLMLDGVFLIVPEGALTRATEITLTLPAGRELEVELEPHGQRFNKPLLLAFSLAGTDVDERRAPSELLGAYFVEQPQGGSVAPREVSTVFQYGLMAAFRLNHFSRYGLVKGLILLGG